MDALAWAALSLAFLCALIIAIDYARHRQKMWIMYVVWPVTALYFGPVALAVYYKLRPHTAKQPDARSQAGQGENNEGPKPLQITAAVYHCGAGCTLGDIAGAWVVFMLGWTFAGAAFQTELVVDFIFAFVLGILFQYFTIAPMRGLGLGKGIVAALRADTASLIAFEIGLFAWMAISRFAIFRAEIHPTSPVHWFMMQIGMILGFFTAYPVNKWLILKGWKEKMG
ncbi:MAG: DUF4396 domain-containing protein [Bryobacteraceae bacterium]